MKRLSIMLVMAAFIVIIMGACSQDYKGLGDAGIGTLHEAKREVIVMPDQFANVVTVCDGYGHRLYVTTRANTTITAIEDPSCDGVSPSDDK